MAHVEEMFYGDGQPHAPQSLGSERMKPLPDRPENQPPSKHRETSSSKNFAQNLMPAFAPRRKPLQVMPYPEVRLHEAPASPVNISPPRLDIQAPEAASITQGSSDHESSGFASTDNNPSSLPFRLRHVGGLDIMKTGNLAPRSQGSNYVTADPQETEVPYHADEHAADSYQAPGLQYHAFDDLQKDRVQKPSNHKTANSLGSGDSTHSHQLSVPRTTLARPASASGLGVDPRGRSLSPLSANGSDGASPRSREGSSRPSSTPRPVSYVELLANVPYSQQVAPAPTQSHASLQSAVGSAASLLDAKKTLDMYRANVKKTNDAAVQYEFAVFMVNAAKNAMPGDGLDPQELTNEAKHILQRLSDRTYPFAQYYLGDGFFSGFFSKGRPDYDRAFPLFVSASKHGHAEAGYRAALCYEFGWGTAKSYPKAVQFYRNSASKNHPGAATRLGLACVRGDMGLGRDKYREGIKWLKRATESADFQYNTAPYEFGLMHLEGDGDDIFKDESYAAQLFTQAADLGHADANLLMGRAYENGFYGLPRDAALSVHFYNGAASRGNVEGMMALCAWYMVGAEPVLDKDEVEAHAWAMQAAELGFAKAQYAVGYFTEMGIGCRRDPLEANVWYVRAADQGNETAQHRLAIIRAAAEGTPAAAAVNATDTNTGKDNKKKFMGIF